MINRQLHRDDNVLFAGYKLPHPLQYKILLRVSFSGFVIVSTLFFFSFYNCAQGCGFCGRDVVGTFEYALLDTSNWVVNVSVEHYNLQNEHLKHLQNLCITSVSGVYKTQWERVGVLSCRLRST